MIAIIQTKQFDNNPDGLREYDVKINHKLICKFMHWRRDGLATCLRKAAEAVDIEKNKSNNR